ncbi:MAG: hypothetical protein FJ042_02525 [Candidatus Cloacimonetes bacterium]|nr:hypothetical protein [Candidatus Cloacimonadota bacterium]
MKTYIENVLQIEQTGYDYFRSLADKCHFNQGVRYILEMLAYEQDKLVNHLRDWDQGAVVNPSTADFFANAKDVFYELKAKINEFSCEIDHLNLYRHARDIHQKALGGYQNAAQEIADAITLNHWQEVIDLKQKQIILLDNIIELLMRPELWVESPEFTHLEDY